MLPSYHSNIGLIIKLMMLYFEFNWLNHDSCVNGYSYWPETHPGSLIRLTHDHWSTDQHGQLWLGSLSCRFFSLTVSISLDLYVFEMSYANVQFNV